MFRLFIGTLSLDDPQQSSSSEVRTQHIPAASVNAGPIHLFNRQTWLGNMRVPPNQPLNMAVVVVIVVV